MNVAFKPINNDAEWQWVKNQVDLSLLPDMTSILAYDKDTKEPLAACIMDSWTKTSCQVHYCIENPLVLRHKFFEEVAKFVFDTAGRLKMYGLVPSDNERALKMDMKIGFKEITRLKDAFDVGVDYVILELTKETCNFYDSE